MDRRSLVDFRRRVEQEYEQAMVTAKAKRDHRLKAIETVMVTLAEWGEPATAGTIAQVAAVPVVPQSVAERHVSSHSPMSGIAEAARTAMLLSTAALRRPDARNPSRHVREVIGGFTGEFDKRRIDSAIQSRYPGLELRPDAISSALNKLKVRGEIAEVRPAVGSREPAVYIKSPTFGQGLPSATATDDDAEGGDED